MGAGIAWKGARCRFYGEYEGIRIIGLREDWARRLGVFICAPLAACSTPAPIAGPILEPRIFDVREARWVSESQLVALLAAARYRLLGEVHDNRIID